MEDTWQVPFFFFFLNWEWGGDGREPGKGRINMEGEGNTDQSLPPDPHRWLCLLRSIKGTLKKAWFPVWPMITVPSLISWNLAGYLPFLEMATLLALSSTCVGGGLCLWKMIGLLRQVPKQK